MPERIFKKDFFHFAEKNNLFLFLFFITAAISLRFFSFSVSVLDHDESTYMIIGRDILNGKLLYTDVTDTKPVGIFLFYAGMEFLFGGSFFFKRMVFAIFVGITGFLIFKVSKKLFGQNKVAYASGIIYILYTSIWNYHGRSPNTELLFNFCTVSGLLFFLKKTSINYFLGGIFMGIGFIIKYLVLFDFAAFMLFFFFLELIQEKYHLKWSVISRYFLAGLAFLIPFGLVNLYFWLGDNFQDFYFITYELPANYGTNPSMIRYFTMLGDFLAKFLPISFLVLYVVFKRKNPLKTSYKWFFGIWVASVLIAIYLPGKEFSHYTIQLMLPLSFLAGIFYHTELKKDKITSIIYSRKTGLSILFVLLLAIQIVSFQNEVLKPDYNRKVAEYISENMEEGDKVFVSNYEQIIYYLLNVESPTPFIHSNLLFTDTHKAFNINANDKISQILKSRPKFILVQRKNSFVEDRIQKDYRLVKTFRNKEILIYQLSS